MKLQEIKPIDITKQISEAFDRVLPYKAIGKEKRKNAIIFLYAITELDPIIKIQITTKNINNVVLAEVSFFTDEKEFEALNTTSSGTAISIIATVVDICKKFISSVDIWFFTAKLIIPVSETSIKEVKSKSRIYSRIAKKFAEQYNFSFQSFNAKEDTGFILHKFSKELSSQQVVEYYNLWYKN